MSTFGDNFGIVGLKARIWRLSPFGRVFVSCGGIFKILSQKNINRMLTTSDLRTIGFGSGRKSGTIVNIWRKYEFGKN